MQLDANKSVFLRKSFLFNKGRYSRTRQIVRGAFFFSLLLNVNVVFGALLMYYLYTIKLTHIWWLFFTLLASFCVPAALRRTALRNVNSQFTASMVCVLKALLLGLITDFKKRYYILSVYFSKDLVISMYLKA